MANIVIYKAIFGDYDKKPKPPPKDFDKTIKFILLADKEIAADGWETIKVNHKNNPVLNNRNCKMFPWKYFDADKSMYLDGHIEFGNDFAEFFNRLTSSDYHFAVNRHRAKGNISDELVRCIDNSKITKNEIKKIFDSNLILNATAVECGMIFRDHNNQKIKAHAERWWWYFNNICPRDQLSVQTAAKDTDITITVLDTDFSNHNFFQIVGHSNWLFKILKARLRILLRVLLHGTLINE